MCQRPFVEGVHLELESVEAEVVDQVPLEESPGLVGDPAAARSRVDCELAQVGDGVCTTFAIGPRGTATGSAIVGQTSDNPAELEQFGYVLRLQPLGKPKLLMWTFSPCAWMNFPSPR